MNKQPRVHSNLSNFLFLVSGKKCPKKEPIIKALFLTMYDF